MPRKKNDGRGRLGGRAKGTPNKVSAELKDWLACILNDGKERFERDIEQLDPSERVRVYMSLLNYVLPKQQSMTAEAVAEAEIKELERLIDVMPDEAADRIAAKIMELQERRREGLSSPPLFMMTESVYKESVNEPI